MKKEITKLFPEEDLIELMYSNYGDKYNDYEVISNEFVGRGRWDVRHRLIFKFQEKTYDVIYRTGATEYQDVEPFDVEDDNQVKCYLVEPIEVKTIYYKRIENNE